MIGDTPSGAICPACEDQRDQAPNGAPDDHLPDCFSRSSLGHLPGNRWEFDVKVAQCFGDMLERSIPNYQEMRALTTALARRYVLPNTAVVDLGASRGDSIKELEEDPEIRNMGSWFIALEQAPAMLEILRARWPFETSPLGSAPVRARHRVIVQEADLRKPLSIYYASVIQSVLTLQFVPVEHRQRLVRDCYRRLAEGGAFILVEKVIGASAKIDSDFVDLHHAMKSANGYTREEIDRKQLALEGSLVPLTARWNEELLHGAGFREVDCFWASLNFRGWIAIR